LRTYWNGCRSYLEDFAVLHLSVEPVAAFHWRIAPATKPKRCYRTDDATKREKRAYTKRFKSAEALENHRANARAYDKRRRQAATLRRMALRVNPDSGTGYAGQRGMLTRASI